MFFAAPVIREIGRIGLPPNCSFKLAEINIHRITPRKVLLLGFVEWRKGGTGRIDVEICNRNLIVGDFVTGPVPF